MKTLEGYLLLILAVCCFSIFTYGQSARQYVINYTQNNYGDTCHSQNWSLVQDSRGIMYFGNSYRVLEYDGENWNTIRTPIFGGFVASMLNDGNRIYIGASAEFGYIEPGKTGTLEYTSLSETLNEEDLWFGTIWKTQKYDDGILFFSQEKIFIYKNDKIEVIDPETSFHLCFVENNELYVRQREIGLMKYNNGKLELLSGGDIFKDYGVFGFFKQKDSENYLVVTQELGLYNYSLEKTDSAFTLIESPDIDFLKNSQIIGGTILDDGNIALNTISNGVIIIDFEGNVLKIFDQNSGLNDNDVKQVYQDNESNLWLATNNGISKICYSSPLSFYNNETGLFGRILAINSLNNKIYIGTSNGLFVQNTNTDEKLYKHFAQVKGFSGDVKALVRKDNKLIIGSREGLFYIDERNSIIAIGKIDASALCLSKDGAELYVAGDNGLAIYDCNFGFSLKKQFKEYLFANALTIAEEQGLNGEKILWLGTLTDGAWKITLSNNNAHFEQNIGNDAGLEDGWIKSFNYSRNVVFGTVSGLMRFINDAEIKASLPDSLKTDTFTYKGYFDFTDAIKLDSNSAVTYLSDAGNIVLLSVNGKPAYLIKGDSSIIKSPFLSIDFGNTNILFFENDSNIWIGGERGLVKFELYNSKEYKLHPNILIRKVICNGDSVLYNGIGNIISTKLDYKLNTMSFSFASLYNENGKKAEYSYMLEGFDEEWSAWTRENEVTFKKIREGDYIFKVKAKDIYGNESEIAEYAFTIHPPWQRTIWAYISYVIILIFLVYLIVKISMLRLKRKNEQLERIVEQRTEEIRQQKDEIEEQKEDIEASINYAKRIQNAVLPRKEYSNEIFNDYFILFKPKDIVSGDFFWMMKIKEYIVLTVADCTGHGVPGAFMSMLGVSFLNEIVTNEEVTQANQILYELRQKVVVALQQRGEEGEQKDGMDMSLCVLNTRTNELQYSGANNSLYIVSGNEMNIGEEGKILTSKNNNNRLYEIKADKMPIAIYAKMDEFVNHSIQLQKGDSIYLFSDGYPDQFGGPKGKKFMYKLFKQMLVDISEKPMQEQFKFIDSEFNKWLAHKDSEGHPYTQIDDVTVMGVRI